MKFHVIDTDRPATSTEYGVGFGWDNNIFDTLEAAAEYACDWMGFTANFRVGVPIYYNETSFMIIIQES